MLNSKQRLGGYLRAAREHRELTQDQLARDVGQGVSRSIIAYLEQGIRIPKRDVLTAICTHLDVPTSIWLSFAKPSSLQRFDFEGVLTELTGTPLTIDGHDAATVSVAEAQVEQLIAATHSESQAWESLNSIMIFYGVRPTSREFFDRYLGAACFSSLDTFLSAVQNYQRDAVRLFSTFAAAYESMNACTNLAAALSPLAPLSTEKYSDRAEWLAIREISDELLADLGYISAARVRQESDERENLRSFLTTFAARARAIGTQPALHEVSDRQKRRMDTLLRKFNSSLHHGLFSPLFAPDPDEVEREATRLAPKSGTELERMEATQYQALGNLASYLSSDHMDVYVATSMRSDADFVSANAFVRALFSHPSVRPLKLRAFNPTQSWIEDRIAKGLVEALMLRRAAVTIYMAQKADTFGKDSEASVALGQGKPVIVYVPGLRSTDGTIDTEALFKKTPAEMQGLLSDAERAEIDEDVDSAGVFARVLTSLLRRQTDAQIRDLVERHWADFDLMDDSHRFPEEQRADFRNWLESCKARRGWSGQFAAIRGGVINILVAIAFRFEQRAKTFREIHPLALQVILSSGVLNGILVVRSVEQCAEVLSRLIKNNLDLELSQDEQNYRLIEKNTGSTIRVISRHRMLLNAFQVFYPTTQSGGAK